MITSVHVCLPSTTYDDDHSSSITTQPGIHPNTFLEAALSSNALKLLFVVVGASRVQRSCCSQSGISRRKSRMEVGEARDFSPNSDLSDAPTSDMEAAPDAQYSAPRPNTGSNGPVQFAGSGQAGVANHASASTATAAPATSAPRQGDTPQAVPAKRKPRAKKESLPADADKPKEKPKRKPRSDKGTTKLPNKKPKLEPAPDNNRVCTPVLTQSSITSTIKLQPQPPSSTNTPPHPQIEARPTSQNGLTRVQNVYESPKPAYNAPVLSDSPTTSSNMYDPVRSVTVQRPSSSTTTPQPMYQTNYNVQSQPQSPFRSGVSPTMASILNNPEPWRTGPPIQ